MADPKVVTLCGSTRFRPQFEERAMSLTLEGVIVLMPHVWVRYDPAFEDVSEEAKFDLDKLHLAKIDLSDEVFVINPGGYIGTSTNREIAYAEATGVPVVFLESPDWSKINPE